MFSYRLERRFSVASVSTAVKIPQLWTSSLDRDVSKTKLSPKQTLHKLLTPDPGRDLSEAGPVFAGLYPLGFQMFGYRL